nr:hypothetical protein [uncultured Allomuricauda sp.]
MSNQEVDNKKKARRTFAYLVLDFRNIKRIAINMAWNANTKTSK